MKQALIILSAVFAVALAATIIGLVIGGSLSMGVNNGGVIRSMDGGSSWDFLPDINKMEITVLRPDKEDPSRLYAGTRRYGIWITEDGGESWKQAKTNMLSKGARVLDLVEWDSEKNILLAAVFSGDRGRVFGIEEYTERELYFTPLSKYAVFGVAVYPYNKNILRIVSSDGGFYESIDSGKSWKSVSRLDDGIVGMVAHPVIGNMIWARTSKGLLLRTDDGGRSWHNLSGALKKYSGADKIETIVFDEKSGALYLGTDYGLLRSYDFGASWHAVDLIIPREVLPVTAVAVDKRDSSKIFAAAKNQLYVSRDNGSTWHGTILPTNRAASSIVIGEEDDNIIYIGLRR